MTLRIPKLRRPFILIAAAWAIYLHSALQGEGAPTSAKPVPTEAQLHDAFAQAEATITAAPEKTREREAACRKAMLAASDIAWRAFDAAKYEDAAGWFARSAQFKKESSDNARAYWEECLRTEVPETEAKLTARAKEFSTQLKSAGNDEAKAKELRGAVESLEKMRPIMRSNTIGKSNTALGAQAMRFNTGGSDNTARFADICKARFRIVPTLFKSPLPISMRISLPRPIPTFFHGTYKPTCVHSSGS